MILEKEPDNSDTINEILKKAYTAQQLHNLILQTMTFCELLHKRSFINANIVISFNKYLIQG